MNSFIREKQIYCGNEYKEVDIYPYTGKQIKTVKGKRQKRKRVTAPKQMRMNDKNARRYAVQLANANFGKEDISVTCTYRKLPGSIEEAERESKNFLRRISYMRKKQGLSPLKYMSVTSYSTEENTNKPIRVHHHILINGGLMRDEIEKLWSKRGKSIGFCNADRIQPDNAGITALATYLVKQGIGKKRFTSSHNLKRPTSTRNDKKYSRKQVEKIAKQYIDDISYWERKYPGWTLAGKEQGAIARHNDITGWAIYLKLRRII